MRINSKTMPNIVYTCPFMDTLSIARYDDWSYELKLPPYFNQESDFTDNSSQGGDNGGGRGCGFFFILVVAILVVYYLMA